MIDLARSQFYRIEELPVKSGQTVEVEGAALQSELENGDEVVYKSDADTDQLFVGVSMATTIVPTITSRVEEVTVPSAAPYSVSLEKNNLEGTAGTNTGEILVVNSSGTALTNDTSSGTSPDSGEYYCDYANGDLIFNSAQAGLTMTVTYRYSPTMAEAVQEFYEGHVNNTAYSFYSRISVGKAPCRFYTDQFVGSLDWANATSIKVIAGGLFGDQTSTGTTLSNARVIHVPDTENPMLGIAID